jgi:hypothetical protein
MITSARGEIGEASIHAVITRADGTVEDLGVIAYHHKNPLRRLWWRVTRILKGAR